ncbi:hypothetical protein D3C80_1665160 [compost metagenome]
MLGIRLLLSRSCEIEVEITSSKPAAVDSAAARPPAAIKAITQPGRLAISGLANTMMSRSTYSSVAASVGALVTMRSPLTPRSGPKVGAPANGAPGPYWILPSPFLSSQAIRPDFSQLVTHCGASL